MNPWDQFTGANAGYVQELYERYQQDPGSVDEATRQAFAAWAPSVEDGIISTGRSTTGPAAGGTAELKAGIAAFTLAESIRRFGHLAARLDPLGFDAPVGDPSLNAAGARPHRRTPCAGCPPTSSAARPPQGAANALRGDRAAARDLLLARPATTTPTCSCPRSATGCGRRSSRRSSARPPIRSTAASCSTASPQVESFERFLHRTFPGKTRFSIEGLDMLVPDPRRDHRRRGRGAACSTC